MIVNVAIRTEKQPVMFGRPGTMSVERLVAAGVSWAPSFKLLRSLFQIVSKRQKKSAADLMLLKCSECYTRDKKTKSSRQLIFQNDQKIERCIIKYTPKA